MLEKCKKWCACLLALVLMACQLGGNVSIVHAEGNAFKNILIVVDAGHTANYNVGSVSGYNEGDWAYKQMLYDAEAYRAAGFTVITTRGQYENPGLVSRGQIAVQNATGYRDVVFISNHTNATPNGSTTASGVNACTSQYLSQANTNLIYAMMTAVAETMNQGTGITYVRDEIFAKPLNSAGADWYGVIRGAVNGATSSAEAAQGAVQYAFILEHGFHTNPVECAFLMDNDNCKAIAAAKANALTQYFGNLYGISYTLQNVVVENNKNKEEIIVSESTTQEAAIQETTVQEKVEEETTIAETTAETTTSFSSIVTHAEDSYNYWSAVVTVEDDGLNVRSEANSFTDNVVTKLPNGTSIVVIGEAVSTYGDVWFLVVAPGGIKGYVNAKYVVPKYYDSRNVTVSSQAVIYSLPSQNSNALSACARVSSSDTIVILNEVKQSDGWWCVVKINSKYVGFVKSQYVLN